MYACSWKYFLKYGTNGRLKEKKKKKNSVTTVVTVSLEQTRGVVVFTYSSNKSHNIFAKYLFSLLVSHSFIFY